MGMTDGQLLRQVQIPLAAPTIMAGIRGATVTTIGTATIAAAIGGGGLGVFIFRGVASVDTVQILAGALPAALIALMVKKTSAARLRIVVTIATKFVSILKRLKKRRTTLLCSIRAITSPAAKRMTKAITPRNVT